MLFKQTNKANMFHNSESDFILHADQFVLPW